LFGGSEPLKAPRGDGTVLKQCDVVMFAGTEPNMRWNVLAVSHALIFGASFNGTMFR